MNPAALTSYGLIPAANGGRPAMNDSLQPAKTIPLRFISSLGRGLGALVARGGQADTPGHDRQPGHLFKTCLGRALFPATAQWVEVKIPPETA